MASSINIEGVGKFRRVDGDDFHIGEYYRVPNGRVYFYHSNDPKTLFLPVLKYDIPERMTIFELKGKTRKEK